MKKLFIFLAAILAGSCLYAAVRTVSNDPAQPAQYNTIAAAVSAATAGDTIYITGSATLYAGTTITKRLTLIGPGFTPAMGPRATIGSGHLYLFNGASGSRVSGLSFTTNTLIDVQNGLNDIIVERCYLPFSIFFENGIANNVVVKHCYLSGPYLYLENATNVLIHNNIIHNYISTSSAPTVIITNNLFIGSGSGLANLSNALITNNIFWGKTPFASTVTNCTFTNNLTYQTSNDVIPYGTNTGSGNLIGVDPQFTDAPNMSLNLDHDYRLLQTSLGKNAGTDGSDIGIHGGHDPIPQRPGVPRIPSISEYTQPATVVTQSGPTPVQFKAHKND